MSIIGTFAANYYRYTAAIEAGRATVNYTPVDFFFEMSSRCNYRCLFCGLHEMDKEPGAPTLLSRTYIDRAADMTTNALSVSLHGYGEPLMNHATIPFAAEIASAGHLVDFVTNGSLLSRESGAKLIAAGMWRVTVSISTDNQERYARLYRNGSLERVVANLAALQELKRSLGIARPEVTFNALAMASTINDLPGLARLGQRVGIGELVLKPMVAYDIAPGAAAEELAYDPAQHDELLTRTAAICADAGIHFCCAAFTATASRQSATDKNLPVAKEGRLLRPCPLAFRGMSVCVDGSVKPCCFARYKLELGNLNEQSAAEIWYGDRFAQFRQQHLDGEVPPICLNCVARGQMPLSEAAPDWLRILGVDPFVPGKFFELCSRAGTPGLGASEFLGILKEVFQELLDAAAKLPALAAPAVELANRVEGCTPLLQVGAMEEVAAILAPALATARSQVVAALSNS